MIYLVEMLQRSGWLQKVTDVIPEVLVWVDGIEWERVRYKDFLEAKLEVRSLTDKISTIEFRNRLGSSYTITELERYRDGAYIMRQLYRRFGKST